MYEKEYSVFKKRKKVFMDTDYNKAIDLLYQYNSLLIDQDD